MQLRQGVSRQKARSISSGIVRSVLRIFSKQRLGRGAALCGAVLACCVLILGSSTAASAQGIRNHKPPPLLPERGGDDGEDKTPRLPEEMEAKRIIRAADKEYQDNLGRARDLSVLGAAIVASFKEKNQLDRVDIKKLEKVEKLAKGIREAAGGSDDDEQMERPPKDLPSAVAMLGDLSKSLKEKVEKTPKHVISAAVIDEANVLLQVVRFVRRFPLQA
jgi:hypothetical protein